MKKLLTFFLTALLAFSVGWAANVIDYMTIADLGVTSTSYTNFSGVSLTSPAIYAGQCARNNNSGTYSIQLRATSPSGIVTTTSGGKVKSIDISFNSNTTNGRTVDVYGKNTAYSSATDLYNSSTQGTKLGSITYGNSSSILTVTGDYAYIGLRSAGNALYIKSITITWEAGGSTTVDAPTISPNGGNFATSQQVTLSHNDADAAIYYTLDGTDPTASSTQYTAPFTIYTTTTVKAIAVKNGVSSSTATATFNEIGVGTIADANALDPTSQFIFTGNAVVTYQNGNNLWIRDASGSGLIYGSGVGTYTNGNILNSGWSATKTVYNGTPEFTNPSGVSLSSQGSTVDPIPLTTLTTDDVNKYVILSNMVIASSTTSNNVTNYTVNGASYTLRDHFSSVTLTVGKTYNVVGVVSIYNNAAQLYLISAEEVSGTPTIIVSPTSLTINDSGTNNTFTVEGSYLGTDNAGVTQTNSDFTPSLSATTGSATNGGTYWYFTPAGGSLEGTVAMNYTGLQLSASNTVTIANNVANASVTVNYVADLYIVTDNGVTNDWHFDGVNGEHMTNNNGVYTATFTAENPNTFILFARKLGEGVTWNTRYVFGPSSGGDWWLPASGNGNGTIDVNTSHPIKIQEAGTYNITIDANAGTFTITKEVVNEGDFVLVTDDSQLNTGDEVIFVNKDTQGDWLAMSTTQNSNNRGTTEVTVTQALKVTATDETQIATLEGDANGWYFNVGNGYLYAASSSNNYLRTRTEKGDDNAKASISIGNNNVANIVFQGSNSRKVMQFNGSLVSCYASASQSAVYLYKRSAGTVVTAPVITPEGGTSNKRFESFNVTITAADGCTIYYTTDGSTPTTSSTQYSVPFLLPYGSEPTTVKAIAVDGQGTVSAIASMTYYWDRVSVTINPASQHVTGDVNVIITATPSDATVTYTINGGAVQTYNGEFIVPVNETNSPVTVEVTATKGESTATTSATYILVDASATLYTKVTSADQIVPGNKYILVYEDTPEALNGVTTGGTGVEVAWATQGSVINVAETNALQFTLGGSANAATLSYGLGSTAYYLEPGNAPGLDLTDHATEGYEWTITESDGGYVLTWGNYVLRYNNGAQAANGRFRIYQPNASTGQLSGHPVYLYVQGAYVTLSDLAQTGVKNKKYTITNQLHAVKVTWDNNKGKFAIFAKDNQEYANKRYPADGQETYLIRYEHGTFINEVEQENYDQSNWIEILIPSGITDKTAVDINVYNDTLHALQGIYENQILNAGSIHGTYVDVLNPTILMTNRPTVASASTYDPNIYCTANFLMENLDADGAQGNDGDYFMMDAKPQELCKVVWAYYSSDNGNYFVIPAREGNQINGHGFHGSFKANMSLCEDYRVNENFDVISEWFLDSDDESYQGQQTLYGFDAIVRKNPNANNANGAPRRIQPGTGDFEQTPAYIVYPLNAGSTSTDNVVDVKELLGGKTIESIHYYNMMGMEGKTPFEGINIVVTRYTDGSTSTYKVMK